MPNCDLDMFNTRCAKAGADAEERYWETIEKEEKDRYKQYDQKELKNAKKCNFCNEFGHVVYQMGILTCPMLKQTACSACGLLGHTPKFCIFMTNTSNIEIQNFVQLYINEKTASTWANKVSQNLTEKEQKKMVDDYILTCKQNVDKYKNKKHE